jgi:hypothetical protein
LHDLSRIPFGRPYDAANFLSVTVDDKRCRQADCADFAQGLTGRVDVHCKVMDGDVRVEFADGVDASTVYRNRNYFELGTAQGSLQAVERRHFAAAWHTPRGPDVEHDDLAVEIGKASGLSALVLEFDRRDRLRCVVDYQIPRRLLRGSNLRARHRKGQRRYTHDEEDPTRSCSERHFC